MAESRNDLRFVLRPELVPDLDRRVQLAAGGHGPAEKEQVDLEVGRLDGRPEAEAGRRPQGQPQLQDGLHSHRGTSSTITCLARLRQMRDKKLLFGYACSRPRCRLDNPIQPSWGSIN